MPAFRLGNSVLAAISAIAAAIAIQPRTSYAYTPEQQQACTPDAMRLCGEFVPDVDRITACMIRNKAQLSPQCRVFFRQGREPREAASDPPGKPRVKPSSTRKTKKTTSGKT
jgi:hypothetical protein